MGTEARGHAEAAALVSMQEVLGADEQDWEAIIRQRAIKGEVSQTQFMEGLQRCMEQTVLRMTSGSYGQRVTAEYLKELEARAEALFKKI